MAAPALRVAVTLAGCHTSAQVLDVVVSDETLAALGARGAALYDFDETTKAPRRLRQGGIEWREHRTTVIEAGCAALAAGAARDRRTTIAEGGREIASPLTMGTRLLGVLLTNHSAPVSPDSALWETRLTVAHLLTTALAGVEAYEKERRLYTQIDVLRRASAAIAEQLAILPDDKLRAAVQRRFHVWPGMCEARLPDFLKPVLQTILEHAMQAVGAQIGAIGINDTAGQPFEPWLYSGVSAEQAAAIGHPPRPVGTLGVVALEGQVIRTSDLRKHPAFRGFPAGHPDLKTLLGVPIRYRDMSVGNLYLANKLDAAAFTAEDEQVVELLASQAAISLQQAYFRAAVDVQRGQLQIIFDNVPQGIVFVDARTDQAIANPHAAALLGPDLGGGNGRARFSDQLLGRDGLPLSFEDLPSTRALAGRSTKAEELSIALSDGRRIPVIVSAAPVMEAGGAVVGVVATFEDISRMKEVERLREEFAAVVAHDLRNPIAAILMQAKVLKTKAESGGIPALSDAAARIERNAARLAEMTNDLLDASRIESGRLTLNRKAVDVPEAAKGLVDRLRPTFGLHPVVVEVTDPVPLQALDPLRFDQILGNLLENAVKFSPDDASIEVRISAREGGVIVSVVDHGMGVAPDDLPRLFDRYYQGKRAREHKTGLGLGLYITKGLVEAHGGRLWLESELNRGSTFHVWFPEGDTPSTEAA